MLDQINALQNELQARIDFTKVEGDYELYRYYPNSFAYSKKAAGQNDGNMPRYCQPCFANKKISVLHATAEQKGREFVYLCPDCKNKFLMSFGPEGGPLR